MTTYFPFQPSSTQAPIFLPTFDEQQYQCTVKWNIFGQRYYVVCSTLNGELIFNVPMLATPPAIQLSSMTWDVTTQRVTVTTSTPHGMTIGSIVNLTLELCSPATYNGAVQCSITGLNTFTYFIATDPGYLVTPGQATYYISMTAGYFNSTLIYRNGQFEVSP